MKLIELIDAIFAFLLGRKTVRRDERSQQNENAQYDCNLDHDDMTFCLH